MIKNLLRLMLPGIKTESSSESSEEKKHTDAAERTNMSNR